MASNNIQRIQFQRRVIRYSFLMLLPSLISILILLWAGDFSLKIWLTALVFSLCTAYIFYSWLIRSVFRPIQSATNLISAIREDDYSMKSRPSSTKDALGELYYEIHLLSEGLHREFLKASESEILLKGIMKDVDVAVFAFDGQGSITLINHEGCNLLNTTEEECLGKLASHFKLDELIQQKDQQTVAHTFPARSGRWTIRKSEFREDGIPHTLLLLQDVSKSLREEERLAWKRLIRVMGHELNNSLAPIKSVSGTLNRLVSIHDIDPELKEDLEDGLEVIKKRTEALSRFVQDYSKIAKLPPPQKTTFNLKKTAERIIELQDFQGSLIELKNCVDLDVYADEAQIEQLLINLTKNAIEANSATGGKTKIAFNIKDSEVVIQITDEGLGLASSDNLFIPFYSTKPGGSGIGLTLSQQIAENHEGSLDLRNREDQSGCIATVRLPHSHSPSI
ncbi:MAG: ATP-binding protein [Opitutales bacterium]|nr:ATP-binding protein [Opitutales bacterium]